jgi:acyl-coenzyme A synthetase/AMP-(fatty) acid ligase
LAILFEFIKMPPPPDNLLALSTRIAPASRWISDEQTHLSLAHLRTGWEFAGAIDTLCGSSVLIMTHRQLSAVMAALALDGIARRILLCPPDIDPAHIPSIVQQAEVDLILTDDGRALDQTLPSHPRETVTEWILFTSGTTGQPKMVAHTLASLSGPLDDGLHVPSGAVWSTFYDVRRYGGLQILLRALLGGGSMVLSSATEPVGEFVWRLSQSGVTHISGTPSHWRRALMSPALRQITPSYVRLSGEIADQAILDHLRRAFPHASVDHAFASTEAGVAFDVRDGRAGFPASYLDNPAMPAELRIIGDTLHIRSSRTASRYLGGALRGTEGFVDTGDLVVQSGDRCLFLGRKEGVINVGGAKVYPEEVEAIINRHPEVQMSRVWARKNPITGAVVAADILLQPGSTMSFGDVRASILRLCRDHLLPTHKVPFMLRPVTTLKITASGKLVRHEA